MYQFNISIFIEPSIQADFESKFKREIMAYLKQGVMDTTMNLFHIDSHIEPDSIGYSLQIILKTINENLKDQLVNELVIKMDEHFKNKYLHFNSVLRTIE